MIYISTPYSDPDPQVRQQRYELALAIQGHLFSIGSKALSPIVLYHETALRYRLPKGPDYWQELNQQLIECCTSVVFCLIPGWKYSKGMQMEYSHARMLGLLCKLMNAESWTRGPYNVLPLTKSPWEALNGTAKETT